MTKKIQVIGDLLRVAKDGFRPTQNSNIRWLYEILKPILTGIGGFSVTPRYHSETDISLADIYDSLGFDKNISGWARSFSTTEASVEFIEFIRRNFEGSVVISFEGNPLVKAALNYLNIKYVDVIVHPIRFLPNLVFGISTNVESTSAHLAKHALSKAEVSQFSGHIQAAYAKRDPSPEFSNNANIAILFLQTNDDRSVIRNGEFLKVSDFLEEIEEEFEQYDNIIVKTHPFNKNEMSHYNCGIPFAKMVESDVSPYKLFYKYPKSDIFSISSSVCHEAQFFDRSAKVFYKPPFDVLYSEDLRQGSSGYISVYENFFHRGFWSDVMNLVGATNSQHSISIREISIPPNFSRLTLNAWWGYDKIFD